MTDIQMSRMVVECGRVFTPSTPISRRALFPGRIEEIRKIVDAVNSAGRHAILYGERGVGKTSLASILNEIFSDHPTVRIVRVNCEPDDNFASIWDKALREITCSRENVASEHVHFTLNEKLDLTKYVGSHEVRKALQAGNEYIPEIVIIFDEFDVLQAEYRAKFAHTIKDFADSQTFATIVLVGVAKDVTDLVAEHGSISRNLAQIKIEQMSLAELRNILHIGMSKLNMTIAVEAAETIEILSQGYPHYTHLLGKEAALSAIHNRRSAINTADVYAAIKEGLTDNSYNIADVYHRATFVNRRGTLFEQVLLSCALAKVDELGFFSSTDVKSVLNTFSKKQYEIYAFSQHLDTFSSDTTRGPVLEKRGSKKCYRYRFVNPLLRPYSIIKGMNDGIVTIDIIRRMDNPVKKKPRRAPRLMPTPKREVDHGLFDDCV